MVKDREGWGPTLRGGGSSSSSKGGQQQQQQQGQPGRHLHFSNIGGCGGNETRSYYARLAVDMY